MDKFDKLIEDLVLKNIEGSVDSYSVNCIEEKDGVSTYEISVLPTAPLELVTLELSADGLGLTDEQFKDYVECLQRSIDNGEWEEWSKNNG